MFVIKKMRLNRFEKRPIVSNRSLFISKGESKSSIVSKDTMENCLESPSIDGASKLKVLGLAEEISKKSYADHKNGNENHESLNLNTRDL